MNNNDLKLKKMKKDKIVLEEGKDEGLLFFFKKNIKTIFILLLALLMFVIAVVTYTISNLGNSTEPQYKDIEVDLEFEDDDDEVVIDQDDVIGGWYPESGYDDKVSIEEEYGNIGLKDGVVFATKTFKTSKGTVIYFSDYSSIIFKKDKTIVRVASVNGTYGIDEKGNINKKAIKMKITKEKEVVKKGMKITYYSDGSASIEVGDLITWVRHSKKLVLDEDGNIKHIDNNKVAFETHTDEANKVKVTTYSDGSRVITKDNVKYLVRNDEDAIVNGNEVSFPNNNAATIVDSKKLANGDVISYYSDGSAIIEKDGETILVRKSNAIVLESNKQIKEIIDSNKVKVVKEVTTPDNEKIKYFDNGNAVIIAPDDSYIFVEENTNIKLDEDNNIIKIEEEEANEIKQGVMPDNTIITNFDNGMSLIEKDDGTIEIVDTDSIGFDINGYLIYKEDTSNSTASSKKFKLINTSTYDLKYAIVLEETADYAVHDTLPLPADHIHYKMFVGGKYVDTTVLNNKVWNAGYPLYGGATLQNKSYLLVEGNLAKKTEAEANLSIWIDYKDLTNEYQDKAFIGTIKTYVWIDE